MLKPEALPGDLGELQARWPELIKNILVEIGAPVGAEEIIATFKQDKSFMDLVLGWEKMPTTAQVNAWEMIQDRLWEAARQTRPFCIRCGECCRRGSPVLFEQDRPLLASGLLSPAKLLTIRAGEKGFSNRRQKTVTVEREQVKIKENPDGRTCLFLGSSGDACLIYEDRPHQCRVMECWDPSRFDRVLTLPPLTREAILGPDNPLAGIMAEHDKKSSPGKLAEALEKLSRDVPGAEEEALDTILFDLHVREFCGRHFGVQDDQMDFFFGSPLVRICLGLGFALETGAGKPPRLTAVQKPTD
ncbi:MAG: YkgJ family cysteine cluster protein [Pseudomonadota bacterium]